MREDAPSLLRGEARRRAEAVGAASVLLEDVLLPHLTTLTFNRGPASILFHAHCHQKSMGLTAASVRLLSSIPGSTVMSLDAGCCGMAGSFGYAREHYDVSRAIAERKLLPAVRQKPPGSVVVATGTSCRHQILDFTGDIAVHPAVLMRSLLQMPNPKEQDSHPTAGTHEPSAVRTGPSGTGGSA
jgi:Fe-S oxidoreductase